jgi:hypothetical protein
MAMGTVTFDGEMFPSVDIDSSHPAHSVENHEGSSGIPNNYLSPYAGTRSLYDYGSNTRAEFGLTSLHNRLSKQPSNALWPFKTHQEAALMRYYVTDLTPWFDHSDTIKHFGSVLPTLAVTCPPLLNAIFAIASQHLCLMGKLDSSVSLYYQDECFRTLLPELQTKAFEASMLAAVSIIRITVHMTGKSYILREPPGSSKRPFT